MKKLFFLLLASLTLLSNAQNRCGTEKYTDALKDKYPDIDYSNVEQIKSKFDNLINNNSELQKDDFFVAGFEHTNVEERGGSGTTCFIVTAVE